ncbi:MAG: trigger factor [Planctomycetota bacterium]|nr:trigger factor [Planctomycetota bacterium]
MDITIDKTEANVAKVQFTVPAKDFDQAYKRGLSQARSQSAMKGFRPGKVPMKMVESKHGEEIKDDIKQHFLRQAYSQAVEENSLKPIAHPRIQKDDTELAEDGSFGMEFEISLRPEIELPEYKGLKIENEIEAIQDTDIDSALEEVMRQQSRTEEATDGIEEDGIVLCNVKFMHGDDEVFNREGLRLSPTTAPPGVDGDKFKELLVGAKTDETIEVAMTLPDTLEDESKRGQEGTCHIQVTQAFNMVPPTTEELCELLQVEDEAGLREKVRESLGQAATDRENNRVETVLLDQLIDSCDIELPGPVLEEQTQNRLQSVANRLAQSGVPHDEIEKELEDQKETAGEDAAKGLKALLIVETLGEKEDLMVTQDDIEAELTSIAARNQSTVEDVRKYYGENNLGQQMAIELLERKVREFLREHAVITDPS